MTNKIAKKCTVPPSIYSNTEIEQIFHRFSLQNPHPQGELYYTNPFTLLVAVLLSAQTTDTGVNKVTPQLFNKAQSAEEMAKLSEEEISHYIRSIGLWKTKAKNIACLSQILWQQYQGHVPASREELTNLPGVGRKTANVVLNIAFHQDTLAVDTHIFRIANRLQLAPGKTADEVEKKTATNYTQTLSTSRTSLVNFAWSLHMQSAPPALRAMYYRRFMQSAYQNKQHCCAYHTPHLASRKRKISV